MILFCALEVCTRGAHALHSLKRDHCLKGRLSSNSGYVPAYIGLGLVELDAVAQGWTSNPTVAMQRAEALAAKSISIDEGSAGAHALLGRVLIRRGNYDRALDELKRAVALNSSDADSYDGLGTALLFRFELSAEFQPTLSVTTFFNLGTALLLSGRTANSVRTLEQSVERYPSFLYNRAMLAAAYAAAGQKQDAARQAEMVHRQFPYFASSNIGSQFRNPQDREKFAAVLKEAGL